MTRHFIGLMIAIISFSFSAAITTVWNLRASETSRVNSPPVSLPAKVEQINKRATFAPEAVNKPAPDNVKFTCNDRLFSFLLNHLRRNDPETDADGFIKGFRLENCTELFTIEQRVDLNKDGRKEYVVRTNHGCGATGNCQTFIVQSKGNGYRIILKSTVEEIIVRDSKTAGYNDIISTYDLGALQRTLTRFRFVNGKYRIRECLDEQTTVDGKRSLRPLKLTDCDG